MTADSSEVPKHSVVVLAYLDSPYLEGCLNSLLQQRPQTGELFVCTSTPSKFISEICDRFNVPLWINPERMSIGADWNFALRQSRSDWVTLAHQDDIYLPGYIASVRAAIEANPHATLILPWFREYADGCERAYNLTHLVKLILFYRAFLWRRVISACSAKVRLLSLGNPISCGGVAMNMRSQSIYFDEALRFTLDWQVWLQYAKRTGDFVWLKRVLMYRRIHKASATSACIDTGLRDSEELGVFRQIWPHGFARIWARLYRLAQYTNRTST